MTTLPPVTEALVTQAPVTQDRLRVKGELVDGRLMSEPMELRPEWIDFNGHLNMAFYGVLFDFGCSFGFDTLGLGDSYRTETPYTSMTADFRIRYIREVMLGDRVRSSFQVLKVGPKSFHFLQELYHVDGWLSATSETLNLNVDATARRVAPYPPERLAALKAMEKEHASLPVPDWVGAPLGVRA